MIITNKTKLNFFIFIAFFILMLFFRVVFYKFFFNSNGAIETEINKALLYGIRFDLKLSAIITIPLFLITLFFSSKLLKRVALVYTSIIVFFIIIFYYTDLGFYSYLGERIDASSLRFLSNIKESSLMVWESYPVIWIFLSQIFLIWLFIFIIKKYLKKINLKYKVDKKINIINSIFTILLLSFAIYGSIKAYPLRWSEAFFSKNKSINHLGLNPVLYFNDSFKFRNGSFDKKKAEKYFPIISEYLGIKGNETLNFKRFVDNKGKKKYNVVIVMMESMGSPCMGYFGNPANVTPYLDSIFKNSISFSNFLIPSPSTAKSVFGSITGLPDVVDIRTASRNPKIINQKIIMNEYKGYEKFYFLGGSANWANIRATFQANIEGIQIYEEGSYENENRVDVWGLSDYDLFKEANKVLENRYKNNQKFIAYIQTSSNHKPYTYPKKQDKFVETTNLEGDFLNKTGLNSLEQVNGFRYADFNIKKFLERAKISKYFDETIFVFFGDHNIDIYNTNFMVRNEKLLGFANNHTPFIIYAPKIIKEKKIIDTPTHLVDLMPTVSNLAGISFNNYTMGRDALKSHSKNIAFYKSSYKGQPSINVITKEYLYKTTINEPFYKSLIELDDKDMKELKDKIPNKVLELDSLTRGFYESTRYLYFNNKK